MHAELFSGTGSLIFIHLHFCVSSEDLGESALKGRLDNTVAARHAINTKNLIRWLK